MPQLWFFMSIAFSFVAWGIVTARYIWPELRLQKRGRGVAAFAHAAQLPLHRVSISGPWVVSPDLPPTFAHSAGYGDIVAAILAVLALISLPGRVGVVIASIFSLWGSADIVNAFYQANRTGLLPGQLGAAYFLPTLVVPLLLITHGLTFQILLQRQNVPAVQESLRLG